MTQKRYEVVSFSHGLTALDLHNTLNSFARKGWRLQAIQPHPRGDRLIFEREVDNDPEALR